MKLFTKQQFDQLVENGKPENQDKDHYPAVKLFLPGTACTWLLTEIDHEYPTIAFGLCDLGVGFPELGSVSLTEIQEVKSLFYTTVERDLFFKAIYPISVYAETARIIGYITESHSMLSLYAPKGLKPKL